MSSANVELVRKLQPDGLDLVEAFSEGATSMMSEEQAALFTDDFKVSFSSHLMGREGGFEGSGPEGLNTMWREWLTPWESYRLDVEEFIDAGDAVVVYVRIQARTERDGVLMHHAPAAVWSIRDGLVSAITFYLDRNEALEAAGLPTEEIAQKSE
jgi:ketosteroid isomerase-like protein